MAGREKRRVCKHFSQIHVPQSAQYSAHEKLILVSKCQMSKRGGVGEFHIIDMFVRLCARDAR